MANNQARYDRANRNLVQPLVVNPISVDTFSAIPMAKNYAKTQGIKATNSLKLDYNVDATDLKTITGIIEPIEANKEDIVTRITEEGVSNDLVSEFINLKKGYNHAKQQVKYAEQTKKDIDAWDAKITKLHGHNGEYLDFIKKKEYTDKWKGTFGANGEINKFDPTLAPVSFNIGEDLAATFKQAVKSKKPNESALGNGHFVTRNVPEIKDGTGKVIAPATKRLVFVSSEGEDIEDNHNSIMKLMQAKVDEYLNPNTIKGGYLNYRELTTEAGGDDATILKAINDMAEAFKIENITGGNKKYTPMAATTATTATEEQNTSGLLGAQNTYVAGVNTSAEDATAVEEFVKQSKRAKENKYTASAKNLFGGAAKVIYNVAKSIMNLNPYMLSYTVGSDIIKGKNPTERYVNAINTIEETHKETVKRQEKIQGHTKEERESIASQTVEFHNQFKMYSGIAEKYMEMVGLTSNAPSQKEFNVELTALATKYDLYNSDKPENLSLEKVEDYNEEANELVADRYASIGIDTSPYELVDFYKSPEHKGVLLKDVLKHAHTQLGGAPVLNLITHKTINSEKDDDFKMLKQALNATANGVKNDSGYRVEHKGNATANQSLYKDNNGIYVPGLLYGDVVEVFDKKNVPQGRYLLGPKSGTISAPAYQQEELRMEGVVNLRQLEIKKGVFTIPNAVDAKGNRVDVPTEVEKTPVEIAAYRFRTDGTTEVVTAPPNATIMYISGDSNFDLPILYTSELLNYTYISNKDSDGTKKAAIYKGMNDRINAKNLK